MQFDVSDIKVGDTISAMSAGERRTGIVSEVCPVNYEDDEGIKNGRPGVAYGSYWCYASQIVAHIPA